MIQPENILDELAHRKDSGNKESDISDLVFGSVPSPDIWN
jgi:hypothetical protein